MVFAACGGGDDDAIDTLPDLPAVSPLPEPESAVVVAERANLGIDSTWHWQLQGTPDVTLDVDVYDLDLFETPPEVIDALQDADRTVICYFSAGSYEAWRPDADGFASGDLGEPLDGFEDERWLDIRSATVRDVAARRLDLAVERGCNGVEPDNVDGYANTSGFDLTGHDQLDFNRFIAAAAHDRGLLVGLKNDLDQIPDLVASYDFAVNEQCHEFDECELNGPFIAEGKPVFNAEYAERFVAEPADVCAAALDAGLRTLILPVDLDGSFRIGCDD